MENCNHADELKSLRSLVVRLAGEMDYKNHRLMEKDEKIAEVEESLIKEKRLLSEKSAAINALAAENVEKEKLLDEKSAAVTEKAEEKERLLHEMATIKGTLQKEKHILNENSQAISALVAQITAKDMLIEEKDLLLKKTSSCLNTFKIEQEQLVNLNYAEICSLKSQNAEKERLIDKKSAEISNLIVEKDQWLEAYRKELIKVEKMKLLIEKLQLNLESEKKGIEKLMKEQNSMMQETGTAELDKDQFCLEPPKTESDLCLQKISVFSDEVQICSVVGTGQQNNKDREDLTAEVELLRKELEEKAEALQNVEMDNRTLMIKELRSNHELQAARRAAIEGLQLMQRERVTRVNIGIKRIGEVDPKPFRDACNRRFSSGHWDEEFGDWEEKSMELCSSWQMNISDPGWQPFKQDTIDGKLTEVIDENDRALIELREGWGNEVYQAVTEALLGINEYNASGRYPVSELWNYKENRRATLGEVVQYVIKQWRTHRKK